MSAVENLMVPKEPPRKVDPDFISAQQAQAVALARAAAAQEQTAAAMMAETGSSGNPKADRYERMIHAVLAGGMADSVEGVLKWAQELCDGIDRDYPPQA